MSKHTAISPGEAADRLAIRELVEAYAYCADRRDAAGQMCLFTPDTHFVVCMDAKNPTPSQELHSREALAPSSQICVNIAPPCTSLDKARSHRSRKAMLQDKLTVLPTTTPSMAITAD